MGVMVSVAGLLGIGLSLAVAVPRLLWWWDRAELTAAASAPSTARPTPVAVMTAAAEEGLRIARTNAASGHHSRVRNGAGTVQSPGSGTMSVDYPPPPASLAAEVLDRFR
jgi:hypothetical protein